MSYIHTYTEIRNLYRIYDYTWVQWLWMPIYHIVSNYGPGVYFSPATFHLATKWHWWLAIWDWRLLFEVLNQGFQAMNSNDNWRHSYSRSTWYYAPWNDSMVHSHHVYKSVWLTIIGEQVILGRSLTANPHNELTVAVIKDSQVVSHIPL